MIKTTAKIAKDSDGFPSQVTVTAGPNTLTAIFDKNRELKITGKLKPELLEALRLIYPFAEKAVLTIPQPLQVLSPSTSVILADDFEATLLKWVGTAAARDTTVAYHGEASMSITCGAGVSGVQAVRGIYFPPSRNMALTFRFALADPSKINYVDIELYFWSNVSDRHRFGIRYFVTGPPANALYYFTGIGGTTFLASLDSLCGKDENSRNSWHNFNFKIRQNNYAEVGINDKVFPMTNLLKSTYVSISSDIYFRVDNVAGQEAKIWVDDIVLSSSE